MAKDTKGHGSNKRSELAVRSMKAKANQLSAMQAAEKKHGKNSLQAYYAGSVGASVGHHYKAGAYTTSKGGKSALGRLGGPRKK